uniref:Uncharacterized protein n=1 Tax=Triticum urartu TaxID=4572 RepID=A0A8R7TTB7_TRIUA
PRQGAGDGVNCHRAAFYFSLLFFPYPPSSTGREGGTCLRPPLLPFALDGALLWWSSGWARLRRQQNHRATRATSPPLSFSSFFSVAKRTREGECRGAAAPPLPPSHLRRCHPLRRLRVRLAVSA